GGPAQLDGGHPALAPQRRPVQGRVAVPARPRLPPRPPARAAAAAPGRGGAAQHPLRPGRYPLLTAPQSHSFVARRPAARRVALRTEAIDGTDSVASPAHARPGTRRPAA